MTLTSELLETRPNRDWELAVEHGAHCGGFVLRRYFVIGRGSQLCKRDRTGTGYRRRSARAMAQLADRDANWVSSDWRGRRRARPRLLLRVLLRQAHDVVSHVRLTASEEREEKPSRKRDANRCERVLPHSGAQIDPPPWTVPRCRREVRGLRDKGSRPFQRLERSRHRAWRRQTNSLALSIACWACFATADDRRLSPVARPCFVRRR